MLERFPGRHFTDVRSFSSSYDTLMSLAVAPMKSQRDFFGSTAPFVGGLR